MSSSITVGRFLDIKKCLFQQRDTTGSISCFGPKDWGQEEEGKKETLITKQRLQPSWLLFLITMMGVMA
jgi:hypothetical protein